MIDLAKCPELERRPSKVGGNWIFTHTRLPLHVVVSNLSAGASLDEIADWFEIDRARVEAVLKFLAQEMNEPAPVEDLVAAP